MHHTRSLLFSIYFHLFFVNGSTIPHIGSQDPRDSLVDDRPCPDGLSGRVMQIQQESLSRPAIYVTDCSPSRNRTLTHLNPFERSALDKRQEQICPADCSNQCSSGSNGGLSTSDCANLANSLSNRNTQFTVDGSQTITMTSGTCMLQLVNLVSSPFIYCDTSWAARTKGLIASCPSGGGTCQGSRFQAIVAVNNLGSSTTAAQAPATTTTNNPTTASQGGGNTGTTKTSGGGNTVNSNSASGPTGNWSTVSSSAPSGALPNTLNGSQSGGSVLALPTGSFGTGGSTATVPQQSSASSTNIPAIIGAVLGVLVLLLLLILFFLWRRKKRAERQLVHSDTKLSPREATVSRTINADSRLNLTSALGFQGTADISDTRVGETSTGTSIWATNNKARVYAEGAVPNISDTDLSSIEPSVYGSTPAPAYRSQSSGSRRERERGSLRDRIGRGSRGDSREHPTVPQQTGNTTLSNCDRDGYPFDSQSTLTGSSNSMSARAFAQAAVPSLSARDIDRLAESIVARMQGRDPALRERIVEEGGSELTEDEPPPPWSAPGVDVRGL